MRTLIETALHYRNAGLSLVVVNDQKKSICYWKKYQTQIINTSTINKILKHPQAWGIAIICGTISGNLEAIDIDEKYAVNGSIIEKYIQQLKTDHPSLFSRLVIVSTLNKGMHLLYRCVKPSRCSVLAQRICTQEELIAEPNQKVKTLIETRGEGGYIIVPPTPGYKFIQHSLETIPFIQSADRQILRQIAQTFNESLKSQTENRQSLTHSNSICPDSPFDDYDRRGDVISLLEKHGWKRVKTTMLKTYFQRPGETTHETSGDFHHEMRLFGVFTSNTDFKPNVGYHPYQVYALLECNENYKLAAKRLISEGYGIAYKVRGLNY